MTTEIELLGGFRVTRDGRRVPDDGWSRRQAASLVKLLALAPNHRLHREQVIDALWPEQTVDEAAPKLHKAAHFARRALGSGDAVVLRDETVSLLPGEELVVDAVAFEAAAGDALARDDAGALAAALDCCGGELLPEDPYEEWLEPRRHHLTQLRVDLLRRLGRWEDLVAIDGTDDEAHVAIMRSLATRGDLHGALRQYERLDRALTHELGVGPGPEATVLRDEILADLASAPARPATPAAAGTGPHLVGRGAEEARLEALLADVSSGRGRTLLVSGPAGVGKTALLDSLRARAEALGWRTGGGTAASVEGGWAYAPVVEAIADLCRRQPTLLDGLDDAYREEIERALMGGDMAWSGEGGHQRLFVAAAELLRLASADRGVAIVIDDLHDADEASLRLLHYLARCAATESILLLLAHRPVPAGGALGQIRSSLLTRVGGAACDLEPLDDADAARLARRSRPDIAEETVERIVELAGGMPFAITELARRDPAAPAWEQSVDHAVLGGVDGTTRDLLQRVAVLGAVFDTDEFVVLSGLPDDEAFEHLDRAVAARVVEHTGTHFRFRHALVREALTAEIAPHRRRRIHREAADRLRQLGASPARVGHHLVAAGDPAAAGPFLIRAAEREAAVGAYRDALDLVDEVQAHVDGADRARALALRADLLFALGDPSAPGAYRHALQLADEAGARLLRARLARAATIGGDVATAAAALDGLETDGGPADPDILLARGNVAYFSGDVSGAWIVAEEARRRVLGGDKTWQVLELVALQGLIAHTRGEWFDQLRVELQRTSQDPELALAIFDGYLCPAEYLLYGPTPYADIVALARTLRDTAQRAGALRAVAFAAALVGEAALLAGDLDVAARELTEAVELHRDIGAGSGEAHSLQRLAEVELARGDPAAATELLERALPLARWSMISLHLLQRIYGTMILAAPDPDSARAVVDRAEATLGTQDLCQFCNIMLAVPSIVACADVGDLDGAARHLAVAERSVELFDGTSWQAALIEARAHLAAAEGDEIGARRLRDEAAELFERWGQPLDALRCRSAG